MQEASCLGQGGAGSAVHTASPKLPPGGICVGREPGTPAGAGPAPSQAELTLSWVLGGESEEARWVTEVTGWEDLGGVGR